MKKLLLLASLFAYMQSKSQKKEWLFELSADSSMMLSDSVITYFRNNDYALKKAYFDTLSYGIVRKVYTYQSASDKKNQLDVVFQVYKKGGNKALEIEGIDRYYFVGYTGKYLDVIQFWKSFIDPKADVESIAKQSDPRQFLEIRGRTENSIRLFELDDTGDKLHYSIRGR